MAAADPSDKTLQSELGEYLSDGGDDVFRAGAPREALGYLRRAQPDNGVFQLYQGLTEAQLGVVLGHKKPSRDSTLWVRRAFSDLTKLAAHDPKDTVNQLELIKVERWLADNLARSGEEQQSLALAQDAISKAKAVAGDVSATPESWSELPRAYTAMAETCRTLGKQAEARQWYRTALTEWDKMRAKGVDFPEAEPEIEEARKGAGVSAPRR